MNEIIKILEDRFQSFINKENDDFIAGLVDYVDFIKETPEINIIIEELQKEHSVFLKQFSEAREKDKKEQTVASSVLLERTEEILKHREKNGIFPAWNKINLLATCGDNNIEIVDFVSPCSRLHRYLIEKMEQQKNEAIEKVGVRCDFDKDTGILTINDKKIKFSRTSKQFELLRVMFEEPYKDWQFSELCEEMDIGETYYWKNVYNIVKEIQKKISIETGIKNFFDTTTQSVIINKNI